MSIFSKYRSALLKLRTGYDKHGAQKYIRNNSSDKEDHLLCPLCKLLENEAPVIFSCPLYSQIQS